MANWFAEYRKTIKNTIENEDICLLGEIEVSDSDYERLMEYTKDIIAYSQQLNDPKPDLLLSMALVQFAIRHYQEGRYWKCFKEEMKENIPSSRINYLGRVFYHTIKHYNLLVLNADGETQQYVENIKAHAFVTNYYMDGYFDFSYAFFENNLFRQLPNDQQEIINDIEDLSVFMNSSLFSDGDSIKSGTHNAAKSYRLLKSTRRVFAQCEATTIYKLFYPTIKMIESNYYDNVLPADSSDRFSVHYVSWCDRNNEVANNSDDVTLGRRPVSKRPYLSVDPKSENVLIVIPAQKFRPSECEKDAKVRITINNHSEVRDLDLRDSFGIYISEELHVAVPSPFDEVIIEFINADERKNIVIKKSSYRILSDNWRNTNKLSIGNNYIIVEKGQDIQWNEYCDIVDSDTSFYAWDFYSVKIDSSSGFQIGTTSVSIAGEYSREPIFDELVTNYELYDVDGKKLIVSQRHPYISFEVDKEKVQGSSLLINNEVYPVRNIKDKAVMALPYEDNKTAVTIDLRGIMPERDGYYKVEIDIPGESNKEICSYMYMPGLECSTNRTHYIYNDYLYLIIYSEKHWVEGQPEWKAMANGVFGVSFKVPIDVNTKTVALDLFLYGDPEARYVLKKSVDVFSYGFSAQEKIVKRNEYIWYADISPNLFIRTGGADEVAVYYGHESDKLFKGIEIEPGVFQIDISEIKERICKNDKTIYQYINITINGKQTYRGLPVILRKTVVYPMYKLDVIDNVVCIIIEEIKGKAKLYLTITDHRTKEVIVKKQYLHEGINTFESLPIDGFFDLHPFMEEVDDFGLNGVITKLKTIWGVGIVNFDDLTGCGARIRQFFFEEKPISLKRNHFITMKEKLANGSYCCYLESVEKDQNGKNLWETKKRFPFVKLDIYEVEDQIKASLMAYSSEEEKWMPLYYDKKQQQLIGPDSPLLMTSTNYDRFESLDEDLSEVIMNKNEISRRL